ncbi:MULTISPECIES: TlpA family protein disulfide reductase [Flavobacterium]|uniref:TlpA disulfide reductase family protein n=1 Tax=Flavobacterium algoritolerans TaxID=3041254 RepID=A0ABT6VAX9_9FLAO|nr:MULTISPECIES: TlpA disulfide reductase family protein [Flavobacterium]MDI5889377.1 TlpA disulfide reductase family protein [Flavobacterium yafengii]MDI5895394.1 TlpA disulfide reductase family protein [Flavobacterium algoritolerans]
MNITLKLITILLFGILTQISIAQTKKIQLNLTRDANTFNLNYLELDLRPLSYADNFRGIPQLDSLKFHFIAIDYAQYVYDTYKDNKIDKKRALAYLTKLKIDTLTLSQKKIDQELVVLIGFRKNKQILIADTNKNKDFSDDIKYEYEVNQNSDKTLVINYSPSVYKFEYFENNQIKNFERKFVLVPDKGNVISQKISKEDVPYLSFVKYVDAWVGEVDGYEFYFSDFYGRSQFYVKDKNTNFSKDFVFNDLYKYSFNDTIRINNSNYTIKRKLQMDSLYLNPIKKGSIKRFTIENKIPLDHSFKDLDNSNFILKDVLKDKDFLLLEFWGTWCGPCLKFNPQIKEFYDINEKKLSILGVALDTSNEKVLKYVKNNNVKWQQAFMKLNSRNSFIEQLNITAYPTVVLLDKRGEIKFVGAGDKSSLELIAKIIKK